VNSALSEGSTNPALVAYFRGFAAMRFNVRVTGSTPIPMLSRAATPKLDSAYEGPKVTLVTVSDPMNVTRANP
jgi:hypothetical protein